MSDEAPKTILKRFYFRITRAPVDLDMAFRRSSLALIRTTCAMNSFFASTRQATKGMQALVEAMNRLHVWEQENR